MPAVACDILDLARRRFLRSGLGEPPRDLEPRRGESLEGDPKSKPFPATIFVDWLTHCVSALSSAAFSNYASVKFLPVFDPLYCSLIA